MQRSKGGVCAAAEVRREDVCGAKRAQKGTSDGSRAEAGHEEEARRLTRQPVFRRSCILELLRTLWQVRVRRERAPDSVVGAEGGVGAGVVDDDGEGESAKKRKREQTGEHDVGYVAEPSNGNIQRSRSFTRSARSTVSSGTPTVMRLARRSSTSSFVRYVTAIICQ